MMTSLAQAYSPHPGSIQHPGVPQGHPMAVPQNPGQQGQPGMPQQMHMGVSGPGGPQVSQAGALMSGMPPGSVVGPSQHAMHHLNPTPQQAQMIQQQQMFNNPQFQMQHQQQMIQQQQRAAQAARQAMMAQQYSGMPVMPNGMGHPQMTQAQYQAMRGNPMGRPQVNLPQHLQQQQAQAQAQQSLEHQQQAAQAQHQQQLMQQQMMQQQQANAQAQGGNNNQGQHNLNPQQLQSLQQQAQIAQQQQHQQQQQAIAANAAQQNQGAQAPPQQGQQQPQPSQQPPQQPQQQIQPQQPTMQQQQQAAAMLQHQQRQQQGEKLRGQCLMRLMQFADHLSNFAANSNSIQHYMGNGATRLAAQGTKQRDDMNYWLTFVAQFFAPKGVLRHSVWIVEETSNKQYEITFPALARYFHTHFESGIKDMQLIIEKPSEKDLPNDGHYIESSKSSFVYWFDNGSQLIAKGTLRAHFDSNHKLELLEFVTSGHEEYLPRTRIIEAARPLHEWGKEWHKVNAPPEGKQSPEMNKKKAKAMKSPPQPPPDIAIPPSKVKPSMGITPSVFRFLELAEVMGQMNPLFSYSHQHSSLAPYPALDQYVATVANSANNAGPQQNPTGPRTPGLPNFPMGASPAAAHLQLPDGSPHISGSPAQAPNMQLQQSQHGTSSSGPSANTSPNASNKRRRPSVKAEDEQTNGTQSKTGVKPSPRIGKRQKPNAP